ncbi:hypothetical protein K493DRAFT_410000 [Basidiobolus meristosporus CBS 931.73]|uniref:Uncharacterized protein n=1 Tax=Basidiobolus meristosporus CBS 931.73 TaxID=1314790 RepID=A0A1Y1XWV1_9FUNG|nr:hypothetical protein K493DRAFT_410000 [Basidiobolus meristosporus CBS 931.73]|eukprot:ORX90220.1 hypothetical protein K493DRAFT_410000 [Basidiobolus meristosporus CBS 931.73]
MFFFPNRKLNPTGKRLLTVIVSFPILVVTSYVQYKRFVLGEPIKSRPTKTPEQILLEDAQRMLDEEDRQAARESYNSQ